MSQGLVRRSLQRSIGVLHPGAMGASIVAALSQNEHQVFWCEAGRSAATRQRAAAAGAAGCASMAELSDRCDTIVSVCPPESATKVAEAVIGCGFDGLFVDVNAISPARSAAIASLFPDAYVDGGVIGPPASTKGTTRLYLSGDRALDVRDLFQDTPLEAINLPGGVTSASALKMSYAAWTKGNAALLLHARAMAEALQVGDALESEWALSQPDTLKRSQATIAAVAPKAWRFGPEMLEIAATCEAEGLPGGFHQAAAEFYSMLAGFKEESEVTLKQMLEQIESERLLQKAQ